MSGARVHREQREEERAARTSARSNAARGHRRAGPTGCGRQPGGRPAARAPARARADQRPGAGDRRARSRACRPTADRGPDPGAVRLPRQGHPQGGRPARDGRGGARVEDPDERRRPREPGEPGAGDRRLGGHRAAPARRHGARPVRPQPRAARPGGDRQQRGRHALERGHGFPRGHDGRDLRRGEHRDADGDPPQPDPPGADVPLPRPAQRVPPRAARRRPDADHAARGAQRRRPPRALQRARPQGGRDLDEQPGECRGAEEGEPARGDRAPRDAPDGSRPRTPTRSSSA